MIEVKSVVKQYGRKRVLDNVSLKIEKGKITSFIGPNGAGKSTLLSIISRLIGKDEGQVYLDGELVDGIDCNSFARKLSILRQSNHLNVRLTVRELVSFGRFPYSEGKLRAEDLDHIERALEYTQLKEEADKYLDELSGGQRQRAFIAMVIAQDTEYILLDEPLNNLDVKHSVEIMKILRRLVGELGKTVVIVMHDINFASCYSDYIVAFNKGQIVKEGNVEEIINKDVLEDVYDTNFVVQDIMNRRICFYY
ncbi:MAG TPA: ATP-binding cassette domain-containing protein [Halanaerobiales bacterium]|mgnify:CR=1 FL=1|nr:ATP-binding cassette domain-containing protein [Halanaerobiales bacterium]HPZ62055.1 ATP-binding cassette domain-containing protein [Halanaerobiales bacterium]HQD03448.1 ATP-binding cassette domain-containing protein [Halanaerobiales bacterium]